MRRVLAIGLLALACVLRAADSTMDLPPLLVEETHQTRPWSYARVPGYDEFLSLCTDVQTRRFIVASYHAQEVLGILLPADMRAHFSVPTAFILYPEDLEKGLAQAMVQQMKATADLSNQFTEQPVRVLPGLRLDDSDSTIIFTLLKDDDSLESMYSNFAREGYRTDGSDSGDPTRVLGIEPSYAQVLLQARTPGPPSWFVAAFGVLYGGCNLGANSIELPAVPWNLEGAGDRIRADPRAPRTLLPMADLFEKAAPSRMSDDPVMKARRQLWEQEAALFMRWAYDGEDPARMAAFRSFVSGACGRMIDEQAFRTCFGFGYARMRDVLSDYLNDAVLTGYTLRCELHDPPAYQLEHASRDEVARIRGDWERRARRYMLNRSDIVSRSFADQARHTLDGAERAGSRDPGVWAVEGLLDFDQGEFDAAQLALQKAADAGVTRPLVYLDLTSLAADRVFSGSVPLKGNFSREQAQAILGQVNKGLALEPKLAGFYAAISDVLIHSDHSLDDTYLPILDQGAHLYPGIPVILYRTAVLEGQHGNKAEMEWLIREGLRRHYPDEDHRAFEALQKRAAASAQP